MLARFATAGAPSVFTLAPPPPVDRFNYSRPSSRSRLLGTNLSCPTKPEITSTRGGADKDHCIDCCDHRKQHSTDHTNYFITEARRTPQRSKTETSVRLHVCTNTHVGTSTYLYRVYTLIVKNFNQGRADEEQGTYGLSDWFKVGPNQLRARQSRKNRYALAISSQNQ